MEKTMQARVPVLLAAVIAVSGLPAQQRVTVNPATGPAVRGDLTELSADGGLVVRTGADSTVTVPQGSIVSVEFPGGVQAPPRGAALVELASGDSLVAVIEGGNFDEIRLATRLAGSFRLFLDHVSAIYLLDGGIKPAELPRRGVPDDAADDELFLLKGEKLDRLSGELQRVERAGIVFDSAAGEGRLFSFINDRIVAVRLAATDPYEEPDGLLCVARFRDGSRVTGQLLGGAGVELRFKIAVGPTVTLDRTQVLSLEFKSPSFRFLSDMKPMEYQEVPYLEGGPAYGLRRDRGFGRASHLSIGETTFRRGVGIHARASCTYDLGGEFDVFRALVGVDPVTRNRKVPGSVRISVLVDGVEAWKSGLLIAGDPPVPVRVSGLKGKSGLTLNVEFGESRGTGARAVFGDAMILKEP